ncbi:hypothetical protein GE09DRAFT_294209 [Coniochaeta sp. 2T2.1]|nr:hypothetical protein GE09DRAFT_294209 [Coniochaeta sp. 2T2.1]
MVVSSGLVALAVLLSRPVEAQVLQAPPLTAGRLAEASFARLQLIDLGRQSCHLKKQSESALETIPSHWEILESGDTSVVLGLGMAVWRRRTRRSYHAERWWTPRQPSLANCICWCSGLLMEDIILETNRPISALRRGPSRLD